MPLSVSHCCSNNKSCGSVMELKLLEVEEGFLRTGTVFRSVGDLDSGPCYAVSLPVLGKSVGWFHASVPICSLGTVTSLVTGVWRT